MPTKKKAPAAPRRTPRQARSNATVDALIEAAARVLNEKGLGGFTTNLVAQRAGVSVGSLYEYFPDKGALVLAVARRQLARDRAALLAAASARPAGPLDERVRRALRALIGAHRADQRVRRVAMDSLLARGLSDERDEPVRAVADALQELDEAIAPLSPAAVFVLTRAAVGAVRAALREQPSLLGEADFEDALVRLVYAFLREPPG